MINCVAMRSLYRVFPNVIPTKCYKRGVLCDLFRENSFILPKDLIELVDNQSVFDKENLTETYGIDNKEAICEYLDFLLERKLVFVTDNDLFNCIPTLNLEWDSPSTITNAQIAISSSTNLEALKVALSELQQLGCKALGVIIEGMPLSSTLGFVSFIDNNFNFILEISVDY